MNTRLKLTMIAGIAISIALIASTVFYIQFQERAVHSQNERTMQKLTESVTQGLQAVMLAGSADVAQSFAARLKTVPEVLDFRILRVDGNEAFHDNATINAVNKRRGTETFAPRRNEKLVPILRANDPNLMKVLETRKPLSVYRTDEHGTKVLTFFAPINSVGSCHGCHGESNEVRGILKMTTSLLPVEIDILKVRQQSLVILLIALAGSIGLTSFLFGRSMSEPLALVTDAMARVSDGDLSHKMEVKSDNDLGRMASRFNQMTSELKTAYDRLRHEQNKLTTIIGNASDGIVVTDADRNIVLVNPAAEKLLGKSSAEITASGFMNLLGKPALIDGMLSASFGNGSQTIEHMGRVLQVQALKIKGESDQTAGEAALLRDITDEKRLEEELRRLSITDELTGLYNRQHLDEAIAVEFHRSVRTGTPLSVLMFDIDNLKQFNDSLGHEQGDRALQRVAEKLREALRKYDVPCRFGGEEFVAILPDTGGENAFSVAERLRQDVEAMRINGHKLSISIGVACAPELVIDTPDALVAAAQDALTQSKQAGRNRTTRASA